MFIVQCYQAINFRLGFPVLKLPHLHTVELDLMSFSAEWVVGIRCLSSCWQWCDLSTQISSWSYWNAMLQNVLLMGVFLP